MKGIIFSEFIELVEEKFGLEVLDRILNNPNLSNGGAYTAVGTYPHQEMFALIGSLSKNTGVSATDLLHAFGEHLFQTFLKNYSVFFTDVKHPFDLLEQIDSHIHIEVKKLYPDAELPSFETKKIENGMKMTYRSERKLSDLAVGLITAAANHYNTPLEIETKYLVEDGSVVEIFIKELN